jgi:hypothetical protein
MIFKSYIFNFFLLFLIVFDLKFPFIGVLGSAFISLVLMVFIILLNGSLENSLKSLILIFKEYLSLIVVYFLLMVYVISRIVVSGGIEPSIFFSFMKSYCVFLSCLVYFIYVSNELDKLLLNVFFINSCICLFVGTFVDLMPISLFFKYTYSQDFFITYRYAFFSGASAFGIAAPYCLFIVYFSYVLTQTNKIRLVDMLKFLIIILSALLSARTTFISIFIASIVFLIYNPKKLVLLVPILCVFIFYILSSSQFSNVTSWMFEVFSNGSNTVSTNELKEMYFLPEVNTFLFGDGKYSSEDGYYMGVDAGYMRHLLFGGIFFVMLVCLVPFSLSNISKSQVMLFFIAPMLFILHFKGAVILNSPPVMATVIVIVEIFRRKGNRLYE